MLQKGWRDSSNERSRKMIIEKKLLGWTTLESLVMFTRQVSVEGWTQKLRRSELSTECRVKSQ